MIRQRCSSSCNKVIPKVNRICEILKVSRSITIASLSHVTVLAKPFESSKLELTRVPLTQHASAITQIKVRRSRNAGENVAMNAIYVNRSIR